jgi:hypothetical protein
MPVLEILMLVVPGLAAYAKITLFPEDGLGWGLIVAGLGLEAAARAMVRWRARAGAAHPVPDENVRIAAAAEDDPNFRATCLYVFLVVVGIPATWAALVSPYRSGKELLWLIIMMWLSVRYLLLKGRESLTRRLAPQRRRTAPDP